MVSIISKGDWRRMGQEKYLTNQKLKFVSQYTPYSKQWEHEHCCFCFAKISPYDGDLHNGYCTIDLENEHWICIECFNDFEEEFKWHVTTTT